MIVLSVKNFTSVNCNLDSSCTDLAKRFARTAACSSKRGVVSCFIGATLLFAATNVTARVSSSFFSRIYAQAPNASCDASAKTHNIGGSTALATVKQLSKETLSSSFIS